jgi:hypothetical protein
MEPTQQQIEQEIIESEARTSEYLCVTPEVKASRLAICATCPAKTTMFGLDACEDCGCVLGFKVYLTTATCPRGNW